MILLIFLLGVVLTPNFATSSNCKSDLEETVCENFVFSPETRLDSGTKKLTIKNAKGVIFVENFSALNKVTEISITESELTDVENEAVCSVPNLIFLKIYRNGKFPKITRNLLKNCQKLKKIYFSGLEIEDGAFAETGGLNMLSLDNSVLPDVLGKSTLEGLDSLTSLTIENSKFHEIEEDAFKNMKNLKFLELHGDGLEQIKTQTFWNLPELKVLNLSNNKLKNLSWDEFKNLKSLKVLFLERNNLEKVDVEKLVENLPELERIFLDYTKLSSDNIKEIDTTLSKHKINVIYSDIPL